MLRVEKVSKSFEGVAALRAVSFELGRGELLGIIGPNGAGKSTLFNVICGHYSADAGSVVLDEIAINDRPPWRIARLGVGRTFQNPRVFPQLTVRENTMVALDAAGFRSWLHIPRDVRRRASEWLERLDLVEAADVLAQELPYGHLRRLEIARACVRDPKLVLLDEPVAGMHSAEKVMLSSVIQMIRDDGIAVVVIEHNMPFVLGLCPSVLVLDFGEVIAQGSPEQIRSDKRVIEAYLGTEDMSSASGRNLEGRTKETG